MISFLTDRPENGQSIIVQMADGIHPAVYYNDGTDGVIEFDDGEVVEVEEYKNSDWFQWRPAEESGEATSLRTAIQQAEAGDVRPVDELWDGIRGDALGEGES